MTLSNKEFRSDDIAKRNETGPPVSLPEPVDQNCTKWKCWGIGICNIEEWAAAQQTHFTG